MMLLPVGTDHLPIGLLSAHLDQPQRPEKISYKLASEAHALDFGNGMN